MPTPKVKKKTTTPTKKKAQPKIQPTYKQPPFDIRMTNLSRPLLGQHAQQIRRGFMVWDKSLPPPGNSYDKSDPAMVKFLFNPSTISTSYAVTDGSAQAALNYSSTQGLNGGALLLPLQQQTSFSLMFDRTYELNDSAVLEGNPHIQNYGVDVDIAALRQYTGMYAQVYSGNSDFFAFNSSPVAQTTGQKSGVTTQTNGINQPLGDLAQGFMQVTIGYLYFGGANVNNAAAGGDNTVGITYYGYIDSWSVEYTHFTQNMVPMRCVVDISFSFLPPPQKAPDISAAAAISAAQIGASGAIGVVGGAIGTALAGR
jgi:hypothetical protein